ncbi:hypothetical protein AKJ56_00555 [candidate division MSBL1 archaeon SCGC-AAA382N08]|uniref:Helicase n=1 Tax=candidate division MSBL1 archaeon SCGC-AAA382N08 TaxID=1698285 RepID=A0A133VQJ3_9EURY|nr:hypothetical protein AKJ56_00555 [candidate division MSBL1 archaeon SCGC-AAA382N08]
MNQKCPHCQNEIKTKEMNSGRWLLSCSNCSICFATDKTNLSKNSAIQSLIDRYEEGALTNDGKTWVLRHGLGKDLNFLDKGVSEEIDIEELSPEAKAIMRGRDEVVSYKFMEASHPDYGSNIENFGFHQLLLNSLKEYGVERFFSFQEMAIDKILEGENVVISAPTATGKTEGFIVPIFQKILEGDFAPGGVQALLIYPTKTLSRDQLRKLRKLSKGTGIGIDVYDGDTDRRKRIEIEEDPPEVLITNFDMIHYHLSRGTNFADLIKSVKFVVVDENHQYVGAFGSNVRFILERMRRKFEADFQVIGASATIGNPKEFSEALFGTDVEPVYCEKGRHGPIHFFMLYPKGRSAKTMLVDVLQKSTRAGKKTVLFGNSHKGVESMKLIADKRGGVEADVHRAGLTYQKRRDIIDRLSEGKLNSVVATPTLELGIDIGDLDAVLSVLVGITSFKQRIGRVARRGQEGLAVLGLRGEDPISSYYRVHPEDYFNDVDPAYCEPENPVVARHQLICAAMDRPIDLEVFAKFDGILEELVDDGFLSEENGKLGVTSKGRKKVENYSIRGIGETVHIWHDGSHIGSRQMPIAARELHPGAVYLHGGKKYRSTDFSFSGDSGSARFEQLSADHNVRTEAKRSSDPKIVEILDKRKAFGLEILYCSLKISEFVDGYYSIDIYEDEVLEENLLEDPIEYSFETLGMVFKAPPPELPKAGKGSGGNDKLSGTFHAIEHSILESSDMLTGGGSGEVGGVAMGGTGVIFAYDGAPGGTGICRLLYDRFEKALKRARSILEECKCNNNDGCPNCTYAYKCGNNNEPLSRVGAIESLEKILSGEETKVPNQNFSAMESIV